MLYKILINPQYNRLTIYDIETMTEVDISINPIFHKLLTGDIFNENKILIKSPIREEKNIPGILLLIGKTYGRCKNGIGRFYYKCIPDDKRLPSFLVPYEPSNNTIKKF